MNDFLFHIKKTCTQYPSMIDSIHIIRCHLDDEYDEEKKNFFLHLCVINNTSIDDDDDDGNEIKLSNW